jgi:hypothetical protein
MNSGWVHSDFAVSSSWPTKRSSSRHVHGFSGDVEAIIDLRRDENVALGQRADAIRPLNGKRSDVKKILDAAAIHFDELVELWENNHDRA